MAELKDFRFTYADTGRFNHSSSLFSATKKHTCIKCLVNCSRGFNIKSRNHVEQVSSSPSFLDGFVCLDCSINLLKELGQEIEDKKDICFFDFNILKRYAILARSYYEGLIPRYNFMQFKEEYEIYVHESLLVSVSQIIQADIEYERNKHLGQQWTGWWLGIMGKEEIAYFNWLKKSYKMGITNVISHYRTGLNKIEVGRVPYVIKHVQEVIDLFPAKFKLSKKDNIKK